MLARPSGSDKRWAFAGAARGLGVSLAFACVLALGLARPALAQGGAAPAAPATPAAPAEPVPPEPQAVAIGNVPDRASEAATLLAQLAPTDKAAAVVEQIEEDLAAFREQLDGRLEESKALLELDPTVEQLRSQLEQLNAQSGPLPGWEETLNEQANAVTEARMQVAQVQEVWEKTRTEARAGGAPSEVLAQVEATRKKARETDDQLVGRRDAIVKVRTLLVEQRGRVETERGAINSALQERLSSVFSRDRAPLWATEVRDALRQEFGGGARDKVVERIDRAIGYARENRATLEMQLLLFAAFLLAMYEIRRRLLRRAKENLDLEEAARVWERPVSAALVLTFAVTLQIHPAAPPLFLQMLAVLALLPAIRLLRRFLHPAFDPVLFTILAFFMVDRVRVLVEPLPTLARVVFFLQAIAAGAVLLWLIRAARLRAVPAELVDDPIFRLLGVALRLMLVGMAATALAELVGFSQLGALLGNGVFRSAYTALFFYAVLRLLESLLAFALVARPLVKLNMVRHHRHLIRRRTERLLTWAAVAFYVVTMLGNFGIWDTVQERVLAILGATLDVGVLSLSLSDVFAFFVTLWLSIWVARSMVFLLDEDVYPRMQLARGMPYAVSALVRYVILFVGFLFAVAASGLPFDRVAVLAGGLGVGIGFGLQNVVNNFVSGLILLFERPIQVGDRVELQTLSGEIRRIGIRASVIRTWSGAEVIVPNGFLISENVTNWTLSDRHRRLDVNVGVAYGSDPHRVLELLVEAANELDGILADPGPYAAFLGFGDSSLDFLLRAWTPEFDVGISTRSRLTLAVHDALQRDGITIPFPQRDLHLKSLPEPPPEAAPGSDPKGD